MGDYVTLMGVEDIVGASFRMELAGQQMSNSADQIAFQLDRFLNSFREEVDRLVSLLEAPIVTEFDVEVSEVEVSEVEEPAPSILLTILKAMNIGQNSDQRQGQIAFNILNHWNPDWANEIRGSDLDPFYKDNRVPAFLIWLHEKEVSS